MRRLLARGWVGVADAAVIGVTLFSIWLLVFAGLGPSIAPAG